MHSQSFRNQTTIGSESFGSAPESGLLVPIHEASWTSVTSSAPQPIFSFPTGEYLCRSDYILIREKFLFNLISLLAKFNLKFDK